MTKKRKMPRSIRKRLQEQRRVKKAINESKERLFQRFKKESIDSGMKFCIVPSTTEKMSEIIIDYARPLLEIAKDTGEQRTAIATAVITWNLSLFPEEMQSDYIDKIKRIVSASNKNDELSDYDYDVLDYLIERRKLLFPDINRMVAGYEFVETPKGFYLNIASMALKDKFNSDSGVNS